MGELLDAAAQLVGPALADMEAAFVRDVATALEESGVAARWALAGISAQALAGQLHATSVGLKHSVATAAEYDGRMTMAVRLVCEPPAA
jgi:hypothetical protein